MRICIEIIFLSSIGSEFEVNVKQIKRKDSSFYQQTYSYTLSSVGQESIQLNTQR